MKNVLHKIKEETVAILESASNPSTNNGKRKSSIIEDVSDNQNISVAQNITGSEILIRALVDQNVDTIYGYPGGVVLGLYDKLYQQDKINHVLVCHEQGGTHAADGYARATGKPGVVIVTSGPGATNTVTGIATAYMDSIPLVVFTGQVTSNMIGNDAFQEADIIGITRPITKHSYLLKDVNDLGEIIHEAFHIATTGKPGPVVIDIPKDVLNSLGDYQGMKKVNKRGYQESKIKNDFNVNNAVELIKSAKKPVIYAGGGVLNGNASKELTEFAKKTNIPVTTTLLGLGGFPENDPLSLGMLGMHGTWYANTAVHECDLLIAVGARFDDRVTGRLDAFSQNSKKIHIDIDPTSIGKNVDVDVALVGNVKNILPEITKNVEKTDSDKWLETIEVWRKEHPLKYNDSDTIIKPQRLIQEISKVTEGNAIVVSDVGQHQMWVAQYYNFNHARSHLSSGGLGTMGYALPASIGAQQGCPDRTVFCIAGDAGIQMTMPELATAVKLGLPLKIAIVNNGYMGMVRQWQEMFFEKRYSHSTTGSYQPNFVALAQGYGAVGMKAETPEEMKDVLAKAMKINDRPVVMDFVVESEENCFPMIPPGAAANEMIEE